MLNLLMAARACRALQSLALVAAMVVGAPQARAGTGPETSDAVPALFFSTPESRLRELDSDSRELLVVLQSTVPAPADIRFSIRSSDVSARAGEDYEAIDRVGLVLPAGRTYTYIPVRIFGDLDVEDDERLRLTFYDIQGATPTTLERDVVILTDDGPNAPPRLRVEDVTVAEGDVEPAIAAFTVRLDKPWNAPVRFSASARRSGSSGSIAQGGVDYLDFQAQVEIPPGATTATVGVPVSSDLRHERDETFGLSISDVSGAMADRTLGVATILDNDPELHRSGLYDDRFEIEMGSGATVLEVLANDDLGPVPAGGRTLSVIRPPVLGSATVVGETIRYTLAAGASGSDRLVYELCNAGGSCRQAHVEVLVRPLLQVETTTAGGGFLDVDVRAHKDMSALRYVASPFRYAYFSGPFQGNVQFNANPLDLWEGTPWNARGETTVRDGLFHDNAPSTPSAGPWRVLIEAAGELGDVDLYVGYGPATEAGPHNLLCSSAMAQGTDKERCEITLDLARGTGSTQYWVMAVNRFLGDQRVLFHSAGVPLEVDHGQVAATGPVVVKAGEHFPVRVSWIDQLLPGEDGTAFVTIYEGDERIGDFPVRVDRPAEALTFLPQPLESGIEHQAVIYGGHEHEGFFLDVPAGASRLSVSLDAGGHGLGFRVARRDFDGGPVVAGAPPPSEAIYADLDPSYSKSWELSGPQLVPGRYHFTLVNTSSTGLYGFLTATIESTSPVVRPGSYFNPARGGHGVFLYPAGSVWAGLWYTYLQDGSATWYYLQGDVPGDDGLWKGAIYRAAWYGTHNRLTPVGWAQVTPTATDAFQFTYTLDGESGSEPMQALGRGCPGLAGLPVDASGHWFNPARAGTGYSVQLFPNYEYYAAFVYDGRGVPRFLSAERNGFGGTQASLDLWQLSGDCPLCERTGPPVRHTVGVLERRFASGRLAAVSLDAVYAQGVPGAWSANETVTPLGDLQGCAP